MLAQTWRAFVILKGAGSVCAAPDGRWSIVAAGSPALATAGSGDVLAGVIAAFIAQGIEPWDALRLAGWVHGRAAENWSRDTQGGGHIGLAASELPDWVRRTLNQELNNESDHAAPRSG
jgi:NAD(P)H-hydrate repair Nnr-like enzyme with NAD(P)H-hydrate dehydratase domain